MGFTGTVRHELTPIRGQEMPAGISDDALGSREKDVGNSCGAGCSSKRSLLLDVRG